MTQIRKFLKKRSKWIAVGAALVMSLAMVLGGFSTLASTPPTYDLTYIAAVAGPINNAWFEAYNPATATGSGVFDTFLRVGSNNQEIWGYNTDGRLEADSKPGPHTHAILLSEIPLVPYRGGTYYELQLDINQSAGYPVGWETLDEMEIWVTQNPDLTGYPFTPSPTQYKVWEIDAGVRGGNPGDWLVLNYNLAAGSGKRDMIVYIPTTGFPACGYKQPNCPWYFLLYVEHGGDGSGTAYQVPAPPRSPTERANPTTLTQYYPNTANYEEWGVAIYEPATKSGVKFEDLNANGIKEAGEPGLANWTIYVDVNDDGQLNPGEPSANTTSTGAYTINGIMAGTWKVREKAPAGETGWNCSLPATSDAYGPYILETFAWGTSYPDNNFGNWKPGVKSGVKFEDMDADGTRDAEDTGLDGWTIKAYADNVTVNNLLDQAEYNYGPVASSVTSGGGAYSLTLNPGKYIVVEVLPNSNSWHQSYPATSVLAPGLTPVGETLGPKGWVITMTSRGVDNDNNFGNWAPAVKSGNKYEDMNANGNIAEDTSHPLDGWTIRAYADNNTANGLLDQAEFNANPVASYVTSGGGAYSLTLNPGKYIVVEVLPNSTWHQSYPATGVLAGGLNTGGTLLGPNGYAITMTSRVPDPGNDFGNWAPAVKSGNKYEDRDADNDISDDLDKPLSGWTIRAYADNITANNLLDQAEYDAGDVASSTTAVTTGAYSLTLNPGKYIVVEVLKNNWIQSYPPTSVLAPGLNTGSETLGPKGHVIIMESRVPDTLNHFGNYQQANLSIVKTGKISYTANVTNGGPATAINVVLDDTLPGNLTWTVKEKYPNELVVTITNGQLHATLASLANGASAWVIVEAPIDGHFANAILPNTATTSSDIYDPSTPNTDDADIAPRP